jgi:hypothetical protein
MPHAELLDEDDRDVTPAERPRGRSTRKTTADDYYGNTHPSRLSSRS